MPPNSFLPTILCKSVASNLSGQNKTAVAQHHPAQGGLTEKPLDDLKPVKDKAVEAKNNTTLAPKSKLGSHFGDDAAIKTQKKESFRDKLLGLKVLHVSH